MEAYHPSDVPDDASLVSAGGGGVEGAAGAGGAEDLAAFLLAMFSGLKSRGAKKTMLV